jgi:hypothetical protein
MASTPTPQQDPRIPRSTKNGEGPKVGFFASIVQLSNIAFLGTLFSLHITLALILLGAGISVVVEASLGERGKHSLPPSLLAQKELPAVARSLPENASVLLLTSIPFPIPYPLYFYPKPCKVLMQLIPGARKALQERMNPKVAHRIRRYLQDLRLRGQLWDRGREGEEVFKESLETVSHVLLFGFVGKLPEGIGLEKAGRYSWGALYRVRLSREGEGR